MKVTTIFGGPKNNGNTSKALNIFEEGLISKGHEIERINVNDLKLNGCLGCNMCMINQDKPYCIQKDDVMSVFKRIMSADVIIYASPLYAFSFPAQLKLFIDRHYCLVTDPGLPNQSSVMKDKRVALLMTCSDPVENNADLVQLVFDRVFGRLNCIIIGKYIIASSSAPDFIERAKDMSELMVQDILNN
jgi:Multimeric flavodoxin WrbA